MRGVATDLERDLRACVAVAADAQKYDNFERWLSGRI